LPGDCREGRPDLVAKLNPLFEDDHLMDGAVPLADEPGAGLESRASRSKGAARCDVGSGLLQSTKGPLVETPVDLLLHAVGNRAGQELSADAGGAGGFIELDPALLEFRAW